MIEITIELILILLICVLLIAGLIYGFVFLDCDLKLLFFRFFGQTSKSLSNKVIWIVGASSGIGEHLALQLAKSGSKLILSGTRLNKLEVNFSNFGDVIIN